jgi:manganese/zinc/iron transport system ATP- binding protein
VNHAALSARNVSVRFGSHIALRDVTFDAPPGTLIGVIGPNGAGKSTLFRAAVGAVPHTGTITTSEEPAYVPQGEGALRDFPATALDVALMGRYGGTPWWRRLSREDKRAAHDALAATGMSDHAMCAFGELSGGQRQRVLLARAIAHGGSVVLLDEPMTGVDTTSAGVIDESISRMRDNGATILVATHDLNDAAARCDLLLFLNREVIGYGPPSDTFTAETLRRTYDDAVLLVEGGTSRGLEVLDDGSHHHHGHRADETHPHVHEHR